MRVKSRKSNKKRIVIVSIIAILIVACGVGAYIYLNNDSSDTTDSSSSSNTQDATSSTEKESESTTDSSQDTRAETEDQTKVEGKTPIQYEGEDFENESTTNDNERFRIPEGE